MSGQMCWLAVDTTSEEKVLHLRLTPHQPWRTYTSFPEYRVSDYDIPGGSSGMATFHQLFKAGWEVIPSSTARVLPTPSEHPAVSEALAFSRRAL